MERGKRRLVTYTNPSLTKLTENGIKKKTNKSERSKSKTVGASLSLLVTSVLNFFF